MTTKQEMRVYRIDRQCEYCHKGNLKFTGSSYTYGINSSNNHRCDNPECRKHQAIMNVVYPQIVYEPIGEAVILTVDKPKEEERKTSIY